MRTDPERAQFNLSKEGRVDNDLAKQPLDESTRRNVNQGRDPEKAGSGVILLTSFSSILVYFYYLPQKPGYIMDVQTDPSTQTKTDSTLIDQPQSEKRKTSLVVRVLKNPLFLVIFTWVIMAFLLAFEVSGK